MIRRAHETTVTGDDGMEAPGWDAIDGALRRLYVDQPPLHYGSVPPSFLGGRDVLQGLSAYRVADPRPHWHFVTYGFSELHAKETEDPAVSGFGFELTFRLAGAGDTEPPPWALSLLQNLGRYVFSSGNGFASGHYLDLNSPIALGRETAIRAVHHRFRARSRPARRAEPHQEPGWRGRGGDRLRP